MDEFDRTFRRFATLGVVAWIIGALLTVAFWGGVLYIAYLAVTGD